MDEQVEDEGRILEKIKIKMDRIKANQQKIQGDINLTRFVYHFGKQNKLLNIFWWLYSSL